MMTRRLLCLVTVVLWSHSAFASPGECDVCGEPLGYSAYTFIDQVDHTMRFVLDNQYTRGQVLLFIEARGQYGVGDVFDWMQYGEGTRLIDGDLNAIRCWFNGSIRAGRND